MSHNQTFDLRGPAGRLEAILMNPPEPPRAAAVVCHAHPLHGGMMHFKVVFRAARALQAHGAAVLRFNFRGVGRSEGTHDHGRGEQDDVRAALDEMERRFPGLPVVLGGFSFGSAMALRVGCVDQRPRALLAMGFPVSAVRDLSFLDTCRPVPKHFVQGERDTFGDGEAIRALAARLSPPGSVHVVSGADHFFTHHLDAFQEVVSSWAAAAPWEA